MKRLPQPDRLTAALPSAGGTCLLSGDGAALTEALTERLSADGWRVIVIDLVAARGPLRLPAGVARYSVADHSERALSEMLDRALAQVRSIDAFVHLDENGPATAAHSPDWSQRRAVLRSVLLTVGRLKPALTEPATGPRKALLMVARLDGRFGLRSTAHSPLGAALFGLAKSAAKEWPDTHCRALDVAQGVDVEEAAQCIVSELYDPSRRTLQVGFDGSERQELVPAAEPGQSSDHVASIGPQSVFLVSGGARGVTASCVLELAKRHRCGFILVGRTPVGEPEPAWAQGCSAEQLSQQALEVVRSSGEKPTPVKVQRLVKPILARREVVSFLRELEGLGARVRYLACDVTQAAQLLPQVRAAAAALGEITGIVHGAGVLADKLIENKTAADFEAVFDAKVAGLAALLGSARHEALRHVALFSSVAGFYGNRGQADYAMANEVLNCWAASLQLQLPACRVVSINWGPWQGGMVSVELQRLFERHGVSTITRGGGTATFIDALESREASHPYWLVGTEIPVGLGARQPQPGRTHVLTRRLELALNPALLDHRIGGRAVLPMVHVACWFGNAAEDLLPGYRFIRIDEMKVFKGIVFDERFPPEFELQLQEQSSGDDTIVLVASLFAPLANGRRQPCYRALLTLGKQLPARPKMRHFDLRQDPKLAGRRPYEDGTLFHGPAFQAITRVLNMSPQGMTVECCSQSARDEAQGQFPVRSFDPYQADACFQAIVIWVRETFAAGSLPIAVDGGEAYELPPHGRPFYVTIEVTNLTRATVACTVNVHDAEGRIYARFPGTTVAFSTNLNQLFTNKPDVSGMSQGAAEQP